MGTMTSNFAPNVERAINKLLSFQEDADLGVIQVVRCGEAAIPALREILFKREPSGLFQARCRAVEALAALGAYNILVEFLKTDRVADDPVERLGDDAVINATAVAAARLRDEDVFKLLLRLAKQPSLTGVIRALGSFNRPEAIPLLVDALEDDASRRTAEAALKKIGSAARPALITTANFRRPTDALESEFSLRRRRSALRLSKAIGISRRTWPQLRALMRDLDARVSIIACDICLLAAPAREKRNAVRRLIEMLAHDVWMLCDEIERCLVAHFDSAREIIAEYLEKIGHDESAAGCQIARSLRRVQDRANQLQQP